MIDDGVALLLIRYSLRIRIENRYPVTAFLYERLYAFHHLSPGFTLVST